jgi:hypothetical protein
MSNLIIPDGTFVESMPSRIRKARKHLGVKNRIGFIEDPTEIAAIGMVKNKEHILGSRRMTDSALYHEVGHSKNTSGLGLKGKKAVNLMYGHGLGAGLVAGGLLTTSDRVPSWAAPAAVAVGGAPLLIDEFMASYHAVKHDGKFFRPLSKAFGTYAAGVGGAVAVMALINNRIRKSRSNER